MTEDQKPAEPRVKILLAEIRDDNGKVVDYAVIDRIPGAIIDRCGRRYQIQKDGSQKRIR